MKLKINNTILIILFIIILCIFFNKRNKNIEKLTNEEREISNQILSTPVNPLFVDMDPLKLYNIFNNDLDFISNTMVKYNVPPPLLQNPINYPKIASYLYIKGALKTQN